MADKLTGIIDPPIDELLSKVDSKYALVIFASKRARQINDYYADLHEAASSTTSGRSSTRRSKTSRSRSRCTRSTKTS
jgi:DNA-directed RNA polymerase omega subunit